jgi:hypothetical protein
VRGVKSFEAAPRGASSFEIMPFPCNAASSSEATEVALRMEPIFKSAILLGNKNERRIVEPDYAKLIEGQYVTEQPREKLKERRSSKIKSRERMVGPKKYQTDASIAVHPYQSLPVETAASTSSFIHL